MFAKPTARAKHDTVDDLPHVDHGPLFGAEPAARGRGVGVVSHVHANPVYDLELLQMFDSGLDALEARPVQGRRDVPRARGRGGCR